MAPTFISHTFQRINNMHTGQTVLVCSLNYIFVFHMQQKLVFCELNIFCTSTTAESRAKIWYQ